MSPSVKQRAVLWPYMLALGCLFALSLVAPRGWQRADGPNGAAGHYDNSATPQASSANDAPSETAAIVHPTSEPPFTIASQPTTTGTPTTISPTTPQPEEPAEKVADQWRFDATAELNGTSHPSQPAIASTAVAPITSTPIVVSPAVETPTVEPDSAKSVPKPRASGTPTLAPAQPTTADATEAKPAAPAPTPPPEKKTAAPKPAEENASCEKPSELEIASLPSAQIAALTKSVVRIPAAPAVSQPAAPPAAPSPSEPPATTPAPQSETTLRVQTKAALQPVAHIEPAWPLPKSLLARLHELAKHDECRQWAETTCDQLERLNRLGPDECAEATALLQDLRRQAEKATPLAARASRSDVPEIRQSQYALGRRLDIWDEVCTARQQGQPLAHQPDSDRRRMQLCLADIRALAETAGIGAGFTQHLMLDTLADLAGAEDLAALEQRRHVARQVLTRLETSREKSKRRTVLEAGPIVALDQQLRRWAAEPLPSDELLSRLEKYEAGDRGSDAHRIALIRQELAWSADPAETELARRLEMHYRNANVRVVLTGQLLQRLLPEPKPTNDPVNETILGAAISGRSMTSAQLSLRLLPDEIKWKMGLETTGTIDSETRAVAGPVTFCQQGNAQFTARKYIAVDAEGIRVKPAVVSVDNNNENLVGIYTSYDSIPLLRSVVRSVALSQREKQQDAVQREGEDRVREKACARVDAAIEPRLVQAEENFRDRIVDPLVKLALDPTAVAMETTEQRLTLRARLAGEDQLAAHTARPEAPGDSLASSQIHESAINNLLDHLDLAGRTFTIPELHRHLAEKLSRPEAKLPDDLPDGVEITFATSDPARVHCAGGRMELVLQISSLRQGRHHWHDFDVRAIYRPDAQGLSAAFEREGVIELGGQYQGKPEVALRGIFSKVLSKQRKLNLLPATLAEDTRLAGLEVTQLEVEEGWIALAIGPTRGATVNVTDQARRDNVTK